MDRESSVILQRLVQQWDEVRATLERMSPGSSVQPGDGWEIIKPAATDVADLAAFEMKPVVFNLPERANHSNPDLYVVAQGRLELRRENFRRDDVLMTHSFATRAGYFRSKGANLDHVFGVHYDVTLNELGHPVFHAQMRGFPELESEVRKYYHRTEPLADHVKGVLRNVRLPSAQMDFFSLVLQVFADHLLVKHSTSEERAAFNGLLERSEFLHGAGLRSSRLSSEAARLCHRACHWYSPVV